MNNYLPILIVEDDLDLCEALCDTLQLAGYETVNAQDGIQALALLKDVSVGLVISDVQMYPMDGHTLLKELKKKYPYLPVLMMTAYGMVEKAVDAMQNGACSYLVKPFEPDTLINEIQKYIVPPLVDHTDGTDMIAQSPKMKQVVELARRVALSDATVLITGESGTGKEVMAKFIHRHSNRASKPFVAINCAAIPDTLLESTLFGHEKGSFTGATTAHSGKFEQAQYGTLLLDEISEMPLQLQAKLLRVLQERELERVGGQKTIALDIRVLATSNRHLPDEVKAGRFREDLYYRLNVFPIELPALRDRQEDILPLAQYLLNKIGVQFQRHGLSFTDEAQHVLKSYHWSGNIRELENIVQRAIILCPNDKVDIDHLQIKLNHLNKTVSDIQDIQNNSIQNEITNELIKYHSSYQDMQQPIDTQKIVIVSKAKKSKIDDINAIIKHFNFEQNSDSITSDNKQATNEDLKTLEKRHILETLISVNGSRTLAAQLLGMSDRTLRYKLQQYRKEIEQLEIKHSKNLDSVENN